MPFEYLRRGLAPALFLVLAATVSVHARQASGRWYDAYDQGIKAMQRGDWVTAEQRLLDARATGPKPGRRVLVYGDSYIAFLPDYYLGEVYLNTGRPAEAEKAFAEVRNQQLIGPKDREYANFQKESQQASAERAAADAKQTAAIVAARPTPTQTPTQTPTTIPTATQPPANPVQAPLPSTAYNPAPVPLQPPAASAGNQYNPTGVPLGADARNTRTPSVSNAVDTKAVVVPPRNLPPPPVTVPSQALRDGLVAFFSGDYSGAVGLLETAVQQPEASPHARLFLACAKAGLVLTGGGNQKLLETARVEYRSADPQRNLTTAQRRFISPRVLEQLERP